MAMTKPEPHSDSRLCIAVKKDGVTLYGNPSALRSLADRLTRIAEADPSEHDECHVTMELLSDDCRFEGRQPLNVWSLAEPHLIPHIVPVNGSRGLAGFEVTFMAVEERDLDDMAQHQRSGILPQTQSKDVD
jgi:hypothetical protein